MNGQRPLDTASLLMQESVQNMQVLLDNEI